MLELLVTTSLAALVVAAILAFFGEFNLGFLGQARLCAEIQDGITARRIVGAELSRAKGVRIESSSYIRYRTGTDTAIHSIVLRGDSLVRDSVALVRGVTSCSFSMIGVPGAVAGTRVTVVWELGMTHNRWIGGAVQVEDTL